MPKNYFGPVDLSTLTGDGQPLLLDGVADFLNRERSLISYLIADRVTRGRRTLCFLYRTEGEGSPADWLCALNNAMVGTDIKSLSWVDPSGLAFWLIEDELADRLPRPEDYGCEAQRLVTGPHLGPTTVVRLKDS